MNRQIRIEPFPPVRGRKMILVNGEQWGSIYMDQHGGRGNSFWFQQFGKYHHGAISDPDKRKGWKDNNRVHPTIKVYGDKIANRLRHGDEAPIKPVEERLLEKTTELINRGLLRSPAEVEREETAARETFRQERAAEEAAKRAAYLAKAHELIQAHAPGLNDRDPLASAIAEELERERRRP